MSTDRRERLLAIVTRAYIIGDTEALTEAIRCAPFGILSRWERVLLALLPTACAADALLIDHRVADGVISASEFTAALRHLGWPESTIDTAVRNVSMLPAWGTPDGRDSANAVEVAA